MRAESKASGSQKRIMSEKRQREGSGLPAAAVPERKCTCRAGLGWATTRAADGGSGGSGVAMDEERAEVPSMAQRGLWQTEGR